MWLLVIFFAWTLGLSGHAYLRACCTSIFVCPAKNKQLDKLKGLIHKISRLRQTKAQIFQIFQMNKIRHHLNLTKPHQAND